MSNSLDDPAVQHAWHYGRFLIRRRYFWEAQEVLEPVWMRAVPNSRERSLMQGLIQLANACLKAEMGRPTAARRLLDLARAHFDEAATGNDTVVLGLDVSACRTALRGWRIEECADVEACAAFLDLKHALEL